MADTIHTSHLHLGASPTAGTIYVSDVEMEKRPGAGATLAQYSKHAAVTWGSDVWDWTVVSAARQWVWAIWKVTVSGSLGTGNIVVTAHCKTGSTAAVKLMSASTLDGTATPDLTADTSGPGAWAACTTHGLVGTGGITFQTGYFAIMTGITAHSLTAEITKLEWTSGVTTTLVWTPTIIGTSGVRLD